MLSNSPLQNFTKLLLLAIISENKNAVLCEGRRLKARLIRAAIVMKVFSKKTV